MHITVGTQGISYVEARTLLTAIPAGVTYARSYDAFNIVAFLQRRLFRAPGATSLTNCLHCDLGLNRADLLHFVNTISLSDTPWLVSFEHFLPRWNPRSAMGMRLLARPSCRRLLAMSRYAYEAQLSLLAAGSALRDTIAGKMTVIHPPQDPLIASYEEKCLSSDALTCTFVGRDFFRKGGKEILEAFLQLRSEGEPIRLRVISSVEWGDYVSGSTAEDARAAMDRMRSAGPSLIHETNVPNATVLRSLIDSHIALLPTYDDTYGFFVLEAQAAATPVITTNICAMPEINSGATGWLIELDRDELGQARLRTPHERRKVSQTIVEGVYTALKEAVHNSSTVRTRGVRALEHIRENHAPAAYAATLRAIYDRALTSSVT